MILTLKIFKEIYAKFTIFSVGYLKIEQGSKKDSKQPMHFFPKLALTDKYVRIMYIVYGDLSYSFKDFRSFG